MPYKNPIIQMKYMRQYSRKYMPIWRKTNPMAAKRIRDRYENSAKGKATRHAFVGIRNNRRRARIQKAKIENLQLISKIYARAAELRQWFKVVVDHIIPLSQGGSHTPDNLQIIYSYENAVKGSRLDYIPKVIFT